MGQAGIQAVIDALGLGRCVLMFPEGERTSTGEVQPLKPGVALLVKRVTCPIVPVGIAGCFQAWNRFMKLPKLSPLLLPPEPSTMAITIGKPIDPIRYKGQPREWIVEDLHREIVEQFNAAERLRRK
jgi:1-acyl-sn-glycerol-3-phosphate acyltransferase